MRVLITAAVGLWAALVPAASNSALVLEPTSQWVIDYANNSCRLIRMFGSDKDRVRLVFEQVSPHSLMTVMLVGRIHPEPDNNVLAFDPLANVQISRGQKLDAVGSSDRIVFWPRRLARGRWGLIPDALARQIRKADPVAAETAPSAPFDGDLPGVKWKDHTWSVEPETQWQTENAAFSSRADEVTAVVLNPGRPGSISLRTGGLGKPLQALEKCATDSLKDWGIDPVVEATVATGAHPIVEPGSLFGPNDYPKAALRSFKQDNLEVWLNIDVQGRIASCRVISIFASPEINDAICGMIQRKESFVPARTKDGTAVPDFYIQSFVFKLQ